MKRDALCTLAFLIKNGPLFYRATYILLHWYHDGDYLVSSLCCYRVRGPAYHVARLFYLT